MRRMCREGILLWLLWFGSHPAWAAGNPDPTALREACFRNLSHLHGAAKAYEQEHGTMPRWLSDLVPNHVTDIRRLTCPKARYSGQAEEPPLADPKLPCSYVYELSPAPLNQIQPTAPQATRREWKLRQAALIGPGVPLIRCRHHAPVLNVSIEGTLFDSPPLWEMLHTNRFSLEALSAAALFGTAPPLLAPTPEPVPMVFSPREKETPLSAIDLTSFYNAKLESSWHTGPGNDLAALGDGLKPLDGLRFDVRGILQLSAGRPELRAYPEKATGIRVERSCQRLHFLHAAVLGTSAHEGKRIGSYVIRFASTQTPIEIPIVYGRDLRDWHYAPDEPPSGDSLKVIWVGENEVSRKTGRPLRLFRTTWTNLLPDLKIDSIDFVSHPGACAPFLLALTVE